MIAHDSSGAPTFQGNAMILQASAQPVTELLGVYSGRINDLSDLGFVWKTEVVQKILAAGVPGDGDMHSPR